jgi:hypothetical protein
MCGQKKVNIFCDSQQDDHLHMYTSSTTSPTQDPKIELLSIQIQSIKRRLDEMDKLLALVLNQTIASSPPQIAYPSAPLPSDSPTGLVGGGSGKAKLNPQKEKPRILAQRAAV